MDLVKKTVFILTWCEQDKFTQFFSAEKVNSEYSDYQFVVLDNGNQEKIKQWSEETGSVYYASEYNIGSSGGYNWFFRVAHLLGCSRAGIIQADVELHNKEVLDVLFGDWSSDEIPFWPQEQRKGWKYDKYPGQVLNLGQIFSFNPKHLIENNLLVDENFVVTHFDDVDLRKRLEQSGVKLYNQLLNYPDIDFESTGGHTNSCEGLYSIHHISGGISNNHGSWLDYNTEYSQFKRSNSKNPEFRVPSHCDRWTALGYPPYPVEYEVNRFWKQYKNTISSV